MSVTCKDCWFYRPFPLAESAPGGLCHREPPNRNPGSGWPFVNPEKGDFCGQHQDLEKGRLERLYARLTLPVEDAITELNRGLERDFEFLVGALRERGRP